MGEAATFARRASTIETTSARVGRVPMSSRLFPNFR
jgi:hypothetical protein